MSQRLTRKRLMDIGNKVLEHQWTALQQVATEEGLDEETVVRALHLVMFDDVLKERRTRVAALTYTTEPVEEIPLPSSEELVSNTGEKPPPSKRPRKKAKEKKGGGN